MKKGLLTIVSRALVYYRLQALYQLVVIILLAAIITGSLLTGSSVRRSLKTNNQGRLGNTGIVISSGVRYFPASLAGRITDLSGNQSVALAELDGWARNFTGTETSLNCKVLAVDDDFFIFNNPDSEVRVKSGEAAINSKLANDLAVSLGDEIVVRFTAVTDIPADSPFSAEENSYESLVLIVSHILKDEPVADFSLAINQIKPKNIFINRDDLKPFPTGEARANRLLTSFNHGITTGIVSDKLREALLLPDIGLTTRKIAATGQVELISDRIFIDNNLVEEIEAALPGAKPVLTYLANRISSGGRSTPYSFVSALPGDMYQNIPSGNGAIINRWIADDLDIGEGDSIEMSYYTSAPFNKLEEVTGSFVVKGVVEMNGIWGDPDLMPLFPGISGSETCSRWEAGIPVKMDDIREKDEDYWYSHRGTPKAFISYEQGKLLWSNSFGPATSIRLPAGVTAEEAEQKLRGQLDPFNNGFRITDARANAARAAANSVDFSTLFLSLGFFIIISSLLLLSLIISAFFESRRGHVRIMQAMGFNRRLVKRILFLETSLVAFTGSIAGVFAGRLFNQLVIRALNSVWKGAVQTDTLTASADTVSMVTGFAVTLVVTLLVLLYKSNRLLKDSIPAPGFSVIKLRGSYITVAVLLAAAALTLLISGLVNQSNSTLLFFAGGTILFLDSFLIYLIILLRKGREQGLLTGKRGSQSWLFYRHYPSRALTPIIFIAAGLFIVITTGANRKSFDAGILSRESGTGGFILWGETATPLTYDLNSDEGKNEYGLSDLKEARFIQAKVAAGDDASCLNLNQVTTPPLLGLDAGYFSQSGAFSFASRLNDTEFDNPWDALELSPGKNIIYGIVDQTVLQWGLMRKTGDTLTVSMESGEPLYIIVAGGLEASVFQGYIIIGQNNFNRYIPSVAGSTIFLADGDRSEAESYKQSLSEILSPYGADIEYTWVRLAEFNQVSNTYLTVFMTLGGFGMVVGVIGLAFILLRNFNLRRRELALLLATGFSPKSIRITIFREHLLILVAGVLSGTLPAILATLPSISSASEVPVTLLALTVTAVIVSGTLALVLSTRSLVNNNLVESLRKE